MEIMEIGSYLSFSLKSYTILTKLVNLGLSFVTFKKNKKKIPSGLIQKGVLFSGGDM